MTDWVVSPPTIWTQLMDSRKARYLSRFLLHQTSQGSMTPKKDIDPERRLWKIGCNPMPISGRGIVAGAAEDLLALEPEPGPVGAGILSVGSWLGGAAGAG